MKTDLLEGGKRTIVGALSDGYAGIKRCFIGNFKDWYYQNCLDLHTEKFKPEDDAKQKINGSWKKTIGLFVALSSVNMI